MANGCRIEYGADIRISTPDQLEAIMASPLILCPMRKGWLDKSGDYTVRIDDLGPFVTLDQLVKHCSGAERL